MVGRRPGRGNPRGARQILYDQEFRAELRTAGGPSGSGCGQAASRSAEAILGRWRRHPDVKTSTKDDRRCVCLITGGAGFVGSHLAEALLERGDEVYVLDDLSTGSIDNIAHLKAHPRFHYTIDTVTNEPLLAELIDRCDTVVHLAAAVGVKLIVEAPVRTIETNVHGTEVVLKLANKKKKLVLIASTSEVYGKSATVPFSEDDDLVLGPTSKHRWAYACSKMIDEFLALAYWKERKLPVIVVRLFNTVGPRQTGQYGMVDPEFRAPGARRAADHRVRRRHAVAQLHLRRRRRPGHGSLDQRAARHRSGLQHRQRQGDLHRGSRGADQGA